MLAIYFRSAWRSLLAHKGTSLVNLIGLVTGIASALVIVALVRYELSFDSFHTNAGRIYRMIRVTGPDSVLPERMECRTGVSYPVPDALRSEVAAMKNLATVQFLGDAIVEVPDKSGAVSLRANGNNLVAVEPEFFDIFDFKGTGFRWIEGNPRQSLGEPFTVVLTTSAAKKFFPDGHAYGKTLRLEKQFDMKVTGIVEDLPTNSDFPFGIMLSYATLRKVFGKEMYADWSSVSDSHQVYVMLPDGITPHELERQISKVHQAHSRKDLAESRHYFLQKLSDIHFDPRFGAFTGRTITKTTLWSLALVAVFLLLTGCINYINLATAQATVRAREIGVRKVLGSSRRRLTFQFLTETFVLVGMAALLGIFLAQFLITRFHNLLSIDLRGYSIMGNYMMIAVIIIVVLVTAFAGLYPSFVISRFNPVAALRGGSSNSQGGVGLRRVLVVAQFAITQILVVGTFIVLAQMKKINDTDLGFNKESIVTISVPGQQPARKGETPVTDKRAAFANQLRQLPEVAGTTFSYTLPSGRHRASSYQDIGHAGESNPKNFVGVEYQSVDTSFLRLYGINLMAGRNFTYGDTTRKILVNEHLAHDLGWSPEEAVGQEVAYNGRAQIIGVYTNFFSGSLRESYGNYLMIQEPGAYSTISIKLDMQQGRTLSGAVKDIGQAWAAVYPDYLFEYQFLDDNINAFYEQEHKYAQMFTACSVLFIIIGCLGLYGLITFVVNQKGKEVAVRKVLGASVSNIIVLFSREYILLIAISFSIAVPVAWYGVNSWLENFANRISLSWWMFALPGFFVLLIALSVVTAKSFRSATANPVDRLRYE